MLLVIILNGNWFLKKINSAKQILYFGLWQWQQLTRILQRNPLRRCIGYFSKISSLRPLALAFPSPHSTRHENTWVRCSLRRKIIKINIFRSILLQCLSISHQNNPFHLTSWGLLPICEEHHLTELWHLFVSYANFRLNGREVCNRNQLLLFEGYRLWTSEHFWM